MGALLARLSASRVALAALPDGRLRATGPITEAVRATIRDHKAAILAELAANEAEREPAIAAMVTDVAELRELLAVIAAGWSDDERADALAAALADPAGALVCFRALVAERGNATRTHAPAREADRDGDMRTCRECANLSPGGRCLAAWRGESFGAGIATSRQYAPGDPGRPQRCGAYSPGPADPDRQPGRERWPSGHNAGARTRAGAIEEIARQCGRARARRKADDERDEAGGEPGGDLGASGRGDLGGEVRPGVLQHRGTVRPAWSADDG